MTQQQNEPALESWKEIAGYLKRDVTTVRRWEKAQGLPVHRHLHESRSSVFAYPSELDAWWAGRTPAERTEESVPPPRRAFRFAALAAAMFVAIAAAGDGAVRPLAATTEAQGVTARQLWAGRMVDTTGEVAPGGRTISFVDWDTGDLAIRDLASGETRRLTNKGTWAESYEFALNSTFSPDGKELAYAWFTKDLTFQLRVVSIESGAVRTIHAAKGVTYLQPSAWSPDGRTILTLLTHNGSTNQIARITASDGSVRILKTLDWRAPNTAVFSPDGRFIAFDFQPAAGTVQRDVFVMSADGTNESAVAAHAANDFLPAWTPDGRSLFFLSDRGGSVGLWSVAVDGGRPQGSPRLVRADIGRLSMMKFDRAGALHYALGTGMSDVYVASVDVAAGMVLEPPAAITESFVGSNRGADWSPDGRQIAYLSQRPGGPAATSSPSIVIRALDNGAERTLRPEFTRMSRPRWSRDGRNLLVYAHDTHGRRGMFTIDADTGTPSLLFLVEGESYAPLPAWSADGAAVFYTYPRDRKFVVHMRTLTTGAETVIDPAAEAHNLAPSPDGKSLAFTYPSNPKDGTESSLVVHPLDGGPRRTLAVVRGSETFALDSLAWTPDGRYLLYVKRGLSDQPHTVWRVPAAGGDAQQLNLPMKGTNVGLRIHPDGRRIAFSSADGGREIWVLENLLGTR